MQKYCSNQVDYVEFLKGTKLRDDYYAMERFTEFRINPISFITSRSERELLDTIVENIKDKNYKG